MKSILAIILAVTGTLNPSKDILYTNAEEMARALPAYDILVEADVINETDKTKNATYLDVLSALLNFYMVQNDQQKNDYDSEKILETCIELGFLAEDSVDDVSSDINREQFAIILCNYLRVTDGFYGVTAGIKYNISDILNISEHALYDVLSLYSAGIFSDETFNSTGFITVDDACEYITRTLNLKPKDDVELRNYLPIIMYHGVNDEYYQTNEFVVSCEMFENDLVYLEKNGYTTLFVKDLVEIIEKDLEFPQKPILITFDDGYEDNYTNAYRLLVEYGMKGIIAPVTKHYYELDPNAYAHISTEQTIEMYNSGAIEFANHSYDLHTNFDRIGTLRKNGETLAEYKEFLWNDLNKSSDFYSENGMNAPIIYAYPYGQYSVESEDIMKEFGYISTFSTEPCFLNVIDDAEDLYALRRVNRPNNISSEEFFKGVELLNVETE